jgi:hypothetical protein
MDFFASWGTPQKPAKQQDKMYVEIDSWFVPPTPPPGQPFGFEEPPGFDHQLAVLKAAIGPSEEHDLTSVVGGLLEEEDSSPSGGVFF